MVKSTYVSEEYIALIFMVELKPRKKPTWSRIRHAGLLFGLERDMFFRNTGWLLPDYMATAASYSLDDRGIGVRVPGKLRIFSSRRPDRLWGPPSLLSNGYGEFSP
jgi:hypothetical protein